MQAKAMAGAAITEADKRDAIALGAWAAQIKPRNMTRADWRAKAQRDFRTGLPRVLADAALFAFDDYVEGQDIIKAREDRLQGQPVAV